MPPFIIAALIGLVGAGLAVASLGMVSGNAFYAVLAVLFLVSNVLTASLVAGKSSASKPSRPAKETAAKVKKAVGGGKRQTGTVKWFDAKKGFGFLTAENGDELFVHFRSIRSDGSKRRGLREGESVEFTIVEGNKGPQAEDVVSL